MNRSLLLASAAIFSLFTPALAQDKDDETIIVTGTRLPQPLAEAGTSIDVIGTETLESHDFVFDALASAPGVTVNQNGGFGGAASVRIRGAGSEQTLVLIDGVPVNDPSTPGGGYDFARLDTADIDRIEILKGPQSTLWGTDAIGGVISIVTKKPEDGLGGSLFADYGSFNTARGGLSVDGANRTGDFRLAVTGITSDGISKADEANGNTEKDGYEAATLSAKGGLNLPAGARLDATFLSTVADTEFDSFVFGAEGSVGDGDENAESEERTGTVTLSLPLLEGRLENSLQAGFSDIERTNFAGGVESFGAKGQRDILRYQGTLAMGETSRLAFGAEREESEADGQQTSITGLFALYELKPVEGLTLSAGLRNDDHETYGSETTGRAAMAWAVNDLVTVHGSWGQGFKAPTLFQTTYFCCGAAGPNPDLAPETSEGFDAGVDFATADGRGSASITVFSQDTENLITFAFPGGNYQNIAEASSTGVEISASYTLNPWLTLSGNYANIDAEDGDGNALIRVPEHSGEIRADIDPAGPFSGAVIVRHSGDQMDSGGPVDGWTRIDLTGRYQLTGEIELYGRVENLTDEEYQQLLGYGTPGLSGSGGIRVRL